MTDILGLYIPANFWVPAYTRKFPDPNQDYAFAHELREAFDCRLIEFIYPAWDDDQLEDVRALTASTMVMIGDEEARYTNPYINHRATTLFGYPYPIVGDVAVFCEKDRGHLVSVPDNIIDYIIGNWSTPCVTL